MAVVAVRRRFRYSAAETNPRAMPAWDVAICSGVRPSGNPAMAWQRPPSGRADVGRDLRVGGSHATPYERQRDKMNTLVTNTDSPFAGAVADRLAERHSVRRIGWEEPLEAGAATDQVVAGINSVVHFGYARAGGRANDLIDHAARRTYNLLMAAAAAGVERCVYVSTLRLVEALPGHFAVTEQWRSRPPSDDPALLACHLGEIIAKECARDRLMRVLTLRIGFPEVVGDRRALLDKHGSAAIAAADAADAIGRALEADLAQWQEVHVQSPVPGARYLMREAATLLAFPDTDDGRADS